MDSLSAISVFDGRYKDKLLDFRNLFSEEALIAKRIYVENCYLEFIINILKPTIKFNLSINDKDFALKVKLIESEINHDVKAVEYYMQTIYKENNPEYIPFIHIGLTSEDINSVSRSLILKEASSIILNKTDELINILNSSYIKWNIPMLARTHGQAATPTNLGKEIYVFADRLKYQINQYKNIEHRTKFGGATGGFNAMKFAYPDIDWKNELNKFIEKFSLKRHEYTTQIDHFDNYSEIFDWMKRINTILINLCQDIWLYCSFDYFKLKINDKEVGSSTMPHKINPIDFENAEGNLKMANILLSFFSEKLPVSRLQRDLTDSTVCRNIGSAFCHTYLAIIGLIKGFNKLEPNNNKISDDLNNNYAILGEAIQTILRKYENSDAYEIVKKNTRNNVIMTKDSYLDLVKKLNIPDLDKDRLIKLTPELYAKYCI